MKRKIVSIILVVCLIFTLLPMDAIADEIADNKCGDNLTWSLKDGTLTVSGTGEMYDYGTSSAPWYSFRSSITKVAVQVGATRIGCNAFSGCTALTGIDLPTSITSIGDSAFADCESLTSVDLPDSITSIGDCAFEHCTSLTSIDLPKNIETLGAKAFSGTGIERVLIPKSLSDCDVSWNYDHKYGPFAGCEYLKEAEFEKGIAAIPSNVFSDCESLERVIIPNSVNQICEGAFRYCTSLSSVNIPNTVTQIDADTFSGSEKIVLYCDYDSYATLYAIEKGIAFKPSGTFRDSDSFVLNREKTEFRANVNSISANGYVTISVSYDIKDIWKDKLENKKIKIVLPSGAELNESTLKLDGVLCKNYSFDGDRVLVVPVENTCGAIKLSAKVTKQTDVTSYATIIADKDGSTSTEIIGIVNEAVSMLTIDAPESVSKQQFTVSGIAPAQADVTIDVGGSEPVTVRASKAGNWTAEVSLTDPQNYHSYKVTATCATEGETALSQNVSVSYIENEATIEEFKLYYNNGKETVDLLNTNGVKPRVYFAPGTEFVFNLKYDHPEQINKVYVVSTRNNEKKYLEATYDESKGVFVTSGYFDANNHNYVPGVIGVEYTKNSEPVYVSEKMDWSKLDDSLYKDCVDEIVEVKEATEFDNVTTIDLGGVCSDLSNVALDTAISIYDEKTHGDLSTWLGLFKEADKMASYVLPGEDGKSYICTLDYSDPYTYIMLIKDVSGNKFIKLAIDSRIENAASGDELMSLIEISNRLSTVNTVAGILYKQHNIHTDMDKLRDEVMSSSYGSTEQRQAALKQVDALENDQTMFMLITTVMPIVVAAAPLALGATMAAPAILFSAMLGVFTSVAPMFWDIRTNQIKGNSVRLNFVVDPSGYVYDVDTLERLENVKATAYCIEYDDSVNFWENKPKDTEYGQKWNAADYDQENPQYTNSEGKYAWDVPEGWWRVKFERDGYETTWSEWMTVPPIQTEVNIGMKKIPHKHCFGEWTIVNVATCIDKGLEVRTCECGETETRTVASLGHDYKNGTCTRCGEKDPNYVEAPVIKITTSSGKPKISWSKVDGAVKYKVYRSTDGKKYSLLATTTGTSITNTKAKIGTTYYYKVQAVGIDGATSDFSVSKSIQCRPAAPTVSISRVSGKAKLSWKAVSGATKYWVYRSTDGKKYTRVISTTKLSYTDSKSKSGTKYYYKVKAVAVVNKKNVFSAYSAAKNMMTTIATPSVSITTSNGKPKITWKAVTGADKYYVYRSTDGKTFKHFATTTKLSYTNTSAKKGTKYYYKVKAVYTANTNANSAFSTVVSIKATK